MATKASKPALSPRTHKAAAEGFATRISPVRERMAKELEKKSRAGGGRKR